MTALFFAAVLVLAPVAAPAAPEASPSPPPGAEAGVSTAATVGNIYTASHMRDPFTHWGAGHGRVRAFSVEDFSVHKLSLRAIMRDATSDFALFVDNDARVSLLFRKGRLYDPKKRPIRGVSGEIDFKRRMVTLTAPEGDVQVFRLGEEEKD